MIQTKRQIQNARDRFGGYAADSRSATMEPASFDTPSDIYSTSPYVGGGSIIMSDPRPAVEDIRRADVRDTAAPAKTEIPSAPADPLYSTRETLKPVQDLPKRPERAKKTLVHEEVMPSIRSRLGIADEDKAAHAELEDAIPERSARRQMSPKTKVMLFIYVAIALVLAIAVIATGVSISNASADAERISHEISAKQATVAEQQTQIALGTDPDAIRDKAIGLGMTYTPEDSATATLVDKVDYPLPTPHTNGFDGFCDWMSQIVM